MEKKKMNEKEIRTIPIDFELREDSEKGKRIVGYGAKFNQRSNILGYFMPFEEIIEVGAFDTVLENDVRALFNHNPNKVLGRTKASTLKISVDDIGLRYEIEPPDATWVNDLLVSMKRGDINQSSFAFKVEEDDWEFDEEREIYKRTVKKVSQLLDVSVVTYPAYENSESVVRTLESFEQKNNNHDDELKELRKRKLEIELEI